jgi:hypothetical protein
LFDGENISFVASLVVYIYSTNIPPIMIIDRIYENQNLLSLKLVSFLVGLVVVVVVVVVVVIVILIVVVLVVVVAVVVVVVVKLLNKGSQDFLKN